jgi:ribose 5-phosphate isomerase A
MAQWTFDRQPDLDWCREITNREQKERVASRLAGRLRDSDVVGVGSGSTSFLTLLALKLRADEERMTFSAIVTSIEMSRACAALGVPVLSLNTARPDWSFDGADEIDPSGRLIKGRGGALFREKLVMAASLERYIVADESKTVARLGMKFAVPIEVVPDAVELVLDRLGSMAVASAGLRVAQSKDGPVITEHGGVILDVRFNENVPPESTLEAVPGVVCTGVFDGWQYDRVAVS